MGYGDAAPRPDRVLGLGLGRRPLFPGMVHSLSLSREAASAAQAEMKAGRPYVGLFLRRESNKDPGGELLSEIRSRIENDEDALDAALGVVHGTGAFAQIHNLQDTPDGQTQALVLVHRRIDLASVADAGPPPRFGVTHWPREVWEAEDGVVIEHQQPQAAAGGKPPFRGRRRSPKKGTEAPQAEAPRVKADVVRALSNEIVAMIRELVQLNPLYREHMHFFAQRIDIADPYKLADFACALATAEGADLQRALEERDVAERLRIALELVLKERELSKLQQEISQEVEKKISGQQRTFMLNEQLKAIKKELGMEQDDKEAIIAKYKRRLEQLEQGVHPSDHHHHHQDESEEWTSVIPRLAKEAIDEELVKLATLEKNSAEFNVTRNYLDWLTAIPWGRHTPEVFDVGEARRVLDEDHYGMDDVKERILELVAVGKLVGAVKGKILCLVGPPGVGKTSIGSSIAKALGREFQRFSVGGLHDVAEIKGHRRTYVGAMPGKPLQALKAAKSCNPLVLLDEIDKLGSGHGGDPASALLELLDPAQNNGFLDHYLDVPVDLSRCLFVCTANVEHTIPTPLLDRMEVVRLAGYDLEEKLAIATQHLMPAAFKEAGLDVEEDAPRIVDDALRALVKGHSREAGVRSLQKLIEKIARKLALASVKGDPVRVVDENNLEDFVGKPKFPKDRLYPDAPPVGVVMGLAWNSMGGSTIYVEAASVSKKEGPPKLSTTGQLGSVMEESSRVALAHVRTRYASDLEGLEMHVHVPEGATPKDGPSAGVTIATALVSLATNTPVRSDLAMTGELSLTGRVLPIGGVKEKVIAARRAGVTQVLMPVDNQRDYDELADYLKEGLTPHFASTFDDVLGAAFDRSAPPPPPPPPPQ
ncbi:hypothetical protein CTAYLR_000412 [Chrysophaeum taylorii]|uniref:Lon protease homolog n=1 Tax=Chrysophaeum taylorii TaxID=2483200 RepID=A0AAD7UG36_9STRA|nr:hypothetical protein CTAYLR_000412 [Chrysophaeum taylorii]